MFENCLSEFCLSEFTSFPHISGNHQLSVIIDSYSYLQLLSVTEQSDMNLIWIQLKLQLLLELRHIWNCIYCQSPKHLDLNPSVNPCMFENCLSEFCLSEFCLSEFTLFLHISGTTNYLQFLIHSGSI